MSDLDQGTEGAPFDPNKGRMYSIVFTAGLAAACGLFLAFLSVATKASVEENKTAKRNRCVLYSFSEHVKVGDTVNFGYKHCYDSSYYPQELNELYSYYVDKAGFYGVAEADAQAANVLEDKGTYKLNQIIDVPKGDTKEAWMLVDKVAGKNIWARGLKGEAAEKAEGTAYLEYYICYAMPDEDKTKPGLEKGKNPFESRTAKEKRKVVGYSLSVAGPGFWEPIIGFLALDPQLFQILGFAVFFERDTPGLGGKCDEPKFLLPFHGKKLVAGPDARGNYETVPMPARTIAPVNTEGLTPPEFLVKSGLMDNQTNAVDAITGATETSNALTLLINKDLNTKLPRLWAALQHKN